MIALGLYAQAREYLAVHRVAVEPSHRADRTAVSALRMDRWHVWAGHERGTGMATSADSMPEVILDTSFVTPASRVVPVRASDRPRGDLHPVA